MVSRSASLLVLTLCCCLVAQAAAQNCNCLTCKNPGGQRGPKWDSYWQRVQNKVRSTQPQAGPLSGRSGSSGQTVFLDFDSGDNGSIDYTPARRDQIRQQMEAIFARFNVAFTLAPPTGEFSTIVFNEGGFGSGLAQDIDFRNLNKSDNAVLNVDGLGLNDNQIVPASANIAAHELGHLLGLRHADIFGPIGDGVLAGFGTFYDPDYAGPQNAFESFNHIMATGGFGAPLSAFLTPNWFSERSSAKLSYAEKGTPSDDIEPNDSIAAAQPLEWQSLRVPNTIIDGQHAGVGDFSISAVVVVGTLNGLADERDIFEFDGQPGDLLNMEVLSNVPNRLAVDPINPNVSVFDAAGAFVNYFGVNAFNESELETMDAILIDLILPNGGSFHVQVDSGIVTDAGNYELMVYRFNGVLGDVNDDGAVDLLDVSPFVNLLVGSVYDPQADVNCDHSIDLLDVSPFVALLTGK